MSTRLPGYALPREFLELVEDGVFEELTRPGDELRNFGVIHPSGFEVRLWVDRLRRGERKHTMFQYGVVKIAPDGTLRSESSGDDLDQALAAYMEELRLLDERYRKRWFEEKHQMPTRMRL